jgi:SCP-2 sterol transfer family
MNEVAYRIRNSYRHRLKEILHYITPEFQTHRFIAVTILRQTLNFQQLFNVCWESWKIGLKEIESEYCYSEYLKPLLQIFDQASSEHTEGVRDEILKYLEDSDHRRRKSKISSYDGFTAMMSGKLKIDGSHELLQQFQQFFST